MKPYILLLCLFALPVAAQSTDEQQEQTDPTPSVLQDRLEAEKQQFNNTFSISQHRQNYVLPITFVTNPNALGNSALTAENVDNAEAKYQLSMKLPIYRTSDETDGVYFGFTLVSFWQLYNSEVSKPFRETNYEPEVFYQWQSDYSLFGINFNLLQVGFNHQSNGQSELRSRSWNRLYASALFSTERDYYYLKTWYRLPEDDKMDPLDPTGDDNPDILDFVGRVELGYGHQFDKLHLFLKLRNNLKFSNNRGSIEANFTYPINDRYHFMLQYFNGYGDSLIDYNRSQERIGIGVQLRLL